MARERSETLPSEKGGMVKPEASGSRRKVASARGVGVALLSKGECTASSAGMARTAVVLEDQLSRRRHMSPSGSAGDRSGQRQPRAR